jgi:hypothetical protein
MGRSFCLAFIFVLLLSAYSAADIWFIKPDGSGAAPTIQAAVDSASTGDTVLLAKGTYMGDGNRDVVISGKTITVISISGDPETCIIDCGGSEADNHRAFDVGGSSIIEGIKIKNGYMYTGGAITGGNGIIRNCVFEGNHATHAGGAIDLGGVGPIEDCVFLENSCDNRGGAMAVHTYGGELLVTRCLFLANHAFWHASAICPWNRFTRIRISYCTFVDNWTSVSYGSTIGHDDWYPVGIDGMVISNCTFVDNQGGIAPVSEEVADVVERTIITSTLKGNPIIDCMTLTCCDIYGNLEGDWVGCVAGQLGVNGNISEDPELCDPDFGDYTLTDTSPCAPDNSPPGCGLIGAHPVGCANASVEPGTSETLTWGAIKALYR